MRTKYVVFTTNNYTMFHVLVCRSLVGLGCASYIVFGYEVGENGTEHLQGYAEFPSRLRAHQISELLPNSYLAPRKGTAGEARDYCQKTRDFEEYGVCSLSGQGERNDLHNLRRMLDEGKSLRVVSCEHFGSFIRYSRGIQMYRNLKLPGTIQSYRKKSVIVYVGEPGTGKTRAVYDNLVTLEDLWQYSGNGWFDGYDGHPIVLFDDFRGSCIQLSVLLRVLDGYPIKVPIKGGFVWWYPEEIYITSNLAPLEWYSCKETSTRALLRRLTNIVYFE